jgi:DhnA family fructose-bisphosphate aldolase class Ia
MSRLDTDKGAVVIAMDHARTLGAVEGLENPGAVIDQMIEAGADGIMTNYGVIKHYRRELLGKVPTFLRLDAGPTVWRQDWLRYDEWACHFDVDDARDLGVDGVCLMAFMGSKVEVATFDNVARAVAMARRHRLPVMVEALPCPTERIPDTLDSGMMASASRIAFELGADIVKTYYTGSPDSFRKVVEVCPVPVLIAGGVKMDTPRAVLEVVRGAKDAGGKGVVFGRNIWQAPDPAGMVRALRAIVHADASVDEAMGIGLAA